MKCLLCKNDDMRDGVTTVTLSRGDTIVLIKGVPARVCSVCEEAYIEEEVAAKLEEMLQRTTNEGAELAVLTYTN